MEFIPEDNLKGPGVRPKGEHTLKGSAQTQVIGLELGSWETPVRRESVRFQSQARRSREGKTVTRSRTANDLRSYDDEALLIVTIWLCYCNDS